MPGGCTKKPHIYRARGGWYCSLVRCYWPLFQTGPWLTRPAQRLNEAFELGSGDSAVKAYQDFEWASKYGASRVARPLLSREHVRITSPITARQFSLKQI